MLLRLTPNIAATFLAAHVTTFSSALAAARWRRVARRSTMRGLVFAKAMPFIGSRASAGFAAGLPALRSQVLLTAWQTDDDFEGFRREAASSLADSWWALFEVASTRGSYRGATPLRGNGTNQGQFAALTLGRTGLGRLVAFLREGARLAPHVRAAPGLIAAVSAGFPLTGNCTVSIWDSEQRMHEFVHTRAGGHADTLRRTPPILLEQLNARMRLRRLGGRVDLAAPYADRLSSLAREE